MKRRILALAIVLIIVMSLCPVSFAEIVGIDKVYIETYPGQGMGNDLPTVGQQISAFSAATITSGVRVTGWSLVDDSGVQCTGLVENKNYTLSITVESMAVNYVFTPSTKAFINGVSANIVPGADGMSATVSRYIKPNVIDPVIFKHPTDENHDKSSPFSFTASASKVYSAFQWYIMTTYGEKFTPEELAAAYPGVTAISKDMGDSVRLNISNPLDDMTGWLVYCVFKGYTGNEVPTNKATMTIKGASPAPTVVETPSPSEGITIVDHDDDEVPEGITIVVTPSPEIIVVETPTPEAEVQPQIQTPVSDGQAAANAPAEDTQTRDKVLKAVKWVGITVGAAVLIGAAVMFISYIKEKKKAARRAKMSGRYKGRH